MNVLSKNQCRRRAPGAEDGDSQGLIQEQDAGPLEDNRARRGLYASKAINKRSLKMFIINSLVFKNRLFFFSPLP
jgi:hypothetical protein